MKKIISIILASIIVIYFVIAYNVQNNTGAYLKYKRYIPQIIKNNIRSTLTKINTLYIYKKSNFSFEKKKNIKLKSLKNNNNLYIFNNPNLIFTGPRAYFASNANNLFLITGTGILLYTPKIDLNVDNKKINFQKIPNNFEEIFKNYRHKDRFYTFTSMVKSMIYKGDSLYVSTVQKYNDTCFTHVIYKGSLNLKKTNFEEFYKFKKCKPYYTDYLGGTIAHFKDNKILFTVGDWNICEDERWTLNVETKGFCTKNSGQNLDNDLGKIFEIDLIKKERKILSIGHDNPQGIFYDKKNKVLFSTEHGPQGGDEININRTPISTDIKNYGYPISSYGEHYGFPSPSVEYKYIEAPLYKSHEKYGFKEPIDYFVPSIGISDIEKYKNRLIVASLGSEIEQGDLSLYIYTLDKNQNIIKKEINKIYQRIRDIHLIDEKIAVIFLESTGSIGIFKLENLN